MTVIIPEPAPAADDAGVAFAAGVAAERADNATAEAEEAAAIAEDAAATADTAITIAVQTETDTWDVKADLAALRADVEDLRTARAEPAPPAEDVLSPEPVVQAVAEPVDTGEPAESKPAKGRKKSGYGNSAWFGR